VPAKGINLLVDQNIIYKKRGVGMFVSQTAKSIIFTKRKDRFYDQYVKPLLQEARRIDLSEEQLTNLIKGGLHNEN